MLYSTCAPIQCNQGFCAPLTASRKHTYIILSPRKPHFYIIKLGFIGVYLIFLISDQIHRLWVLVRTASVRRFQRVPTKFEQKYGWYKIFFIWKLSDFGGEIFNILKRRVFLMGSWNTIECIKVHKGPTKRSLSRWSKLYFRTCSKILFHLCTN